MNYQFYFDTREDAINFYERVYELAKGYDVVSLSDLCDLKGSESCWLDNKYIWNKDSIMLDVHYELRPGVGYVVVFPEPDQHPDYCTTKPKYKDFYGKYRRATTPHSIVYTKQTPTSEPLNITILMDPSKDPYTTIREVIYQANEIKDRPVFITID